MNKIHDKYRNGKSTYRDHIWTRIVSSTEMGSRSLRIENEADKGQVQKLAVILWISNINYKSMASM